MAALLPTLGWTAELTEPCNPRNPRTCEIAQKTFAGRPYKSQSMLFVRLIRPTEIRS